MTQSSISTKLVATTTIYLCTCLSLLSLINNSVELHDLASPSLVCGFDLFKGSI